MIIFFFMNMLLLQIVTCLITCLSDTAMANVGKEEWSLRGLTDDIKPYRPAEHTQRSSTPVHSCKILSCAALLFDVVPSWTCFAVLSFCCEGKFNVIAQLAPTFLRAATTGEYFSFTVFVSSSVIVMLQLCVLLSHH